MTGSVITQWISKPVTIVNIYNPIALNNSKPAVATTLDKCKYGSQGHSDENLPVKFQFKHKYPLVRTIHELKVLQIVEIKKARKKSVHTGIKHLISLPDYKNSQ